MDMGTLHLFPVPISDSFHKNTIPPGLIEAAQNIQDWIVETPKAARKKLKIIAPTTAISEQRLFPLDKFNIKNNFSILLEPCLKGKDMGLISDAGSPAIADPGAMIIAEAHRLGIKVKPWVGPSSILLGLMASGLNGQSFSFLGYLPHDKSERKILLIKMERNIRDGITQIFIETPYRNVKIIEELSKSLSGDIFMCAACNLNSDKEIIISKSISEWKQEKRIISFHKEPTIFILGRSSKLI
ncbi:MAG: Ribosomal RNA small subunit methyltransferase I [Owenweeksia sp. TMED14]|nr:MAG: Ribosomal RNA small subunit methyltransferase I [Owenweeksia sp. TMED14]|tara:strand:- start:1790 stop:2515 length:726 start_codon:yes stop_codon:yes gene_type:complete